MGMERRAIGPLQIEGMAEHAAPIVFKAMLDSAADELGWAMRAASAANRYFDHVVHRACRASRWRGCLAAGRQKPLRRHQRARRAPCSDSTSPRSAATRSAVKEIDGTRRDDGHDGSPPSVNLSASQRRSRPSIPTVCSNACWRKPSPRRGSDAGAIYLFDDERRTLTSARGAMRGATGSGAADREMTMRRSWTTPFAALSRAAAPVVTRL